MRAIRGLVVRRPGAKIGRRMVPSRFVGVGVAVMLVLGAAGFALGRTSQQLSVSSGPDDAWLPTSGHGSVSLVNGLTGRSGLELIIPGAKGHSLSVDQQGTTVLVDDATSGEIIRIDASQLTIGPAVAVGQGTAVFTAAAATYLVDYSTGAVTRVDPVTLRATSAAFHVAGTLGKQAAVAADGTLWIPVLDNGTAVPVTASGVGTPVQISRGRSANLAMTSIGGRTVAVDQTTNSITVVGGGGPKTIGLPASTGAAPLLVPDAADGSAGSAFLPILAATQTPSLVLANVADGSTRAVALGPVGSDQLGVPVMAGGRVYIPDYTRGSALVYDVTQGRQQPDVTVTGSAGNFDAKVVNGVVFFNDPSTAYAVTVDPSGGVHRVAKTGPGVPSGTGRPPAPTPSPTQSPSAPAHPVHSAAPPAAGAPPVITTAPHSTKPSPQPPKTRQPSPPAPPPAPLAPAGVTATSGDGYVDVSWTAPTSGGQIASYQVQVSPAGGSQSALSATSVRISGLACSTSYGFTVASVGTHGEIVAAAAVYAHPCLPPGAPTGLVVSDKAGYTRVIDLSWNAVTSSNGTVTYLISWSGGSQTSTTNSTSITDLLPGHKYTFTVRAVDAAGTGPGTSNWGIPGNDDAKTGTMADQYTIYTQPTDTSAVAWSAPKGASYTSYCQYNGGQRLTDPGGSSATWVYMQNDGVFGWANTLWFTDWYLADKLLACRSPLVPVP